MTRPLLAGFERPLTLDVGREQHGFTDIDYKTNTLEPGRHIVIYGLGGDVRRSRVGFRDNPDWRDTGDLLRDFPDKGAKIFRVYRDTEIPVDSVKGSEFGFELPGGGQAVIRGGQRDDDHRDHAPLDPDHPTFGGRARALVARYKESDYPDPKAHTLGEPNDVSADDLPDVYEGFHLHTARRAMYDLGEVTQLYVVGPDSTGRDLPHALLYYRNDLSRGRLDLRGRVSKSAWEYPDVPWGTIVCELMDLLPTCTPEIQLIPSHSPKLVYSHDLEHSTDGRIYGRINVNTAERDVLKQLPWPDDFFAGGDRYVMNDYQVARAIDYLLAYRDRTRYARSPDYTSRATASNVPRLRARSRHGGFLTPAEVAIPLGDYVRDRLGAEFDYASRRTDYMSIRGRDSLYRAISNCITVNTDTYAATILVQVGEGEKVRRRWRYLTLIDRSHAPDRWRESARGNPSMLLFSALR